MYVSPYEYSRHICGHWADCDTCLAFIRHEIGAFNGDADRLTLAGQSSGAEMIKSLLMTPSAKNLFSNAILQSPPLGNADQTLAIANAIGNVFTEGIKCTTKVCLQSSSIDNIYQQQAEVYYSEHQIVGLNPVEPFRVAVDGHTVQGSFGHVVQYGGELPGGAGKPLIFTNMKDEACTAVSQK